MDGSCCAGLFNPSGVEMLFRSMTTGSVASRRNPWLFVCNRCRGMYLLAGRLLCWRSAPQPVAVRVQSLLRCVWIHELATVLAKRAGFTIALRYVGANPYVRPCLKGRHAGLPLRLRAVLVFRPLLVMNLSFSSSPRRRESRGTGTSLSCRTRYGSPPARG